MQHRYALVCYYQPGCGLFHYECNSKGEAEAKRTEIRKALALRKTEESLKRADIYQLSKDCLCTFHTPFGKELFEVLLVDGHILHALITQPIEASGNRSGTFNMTLAHAKTEPGVYLWAASL
jgi:hypothetical protein